MNKYRMFFCLLVSACAVQTVLAETKPTLRHRSAALQCADRKIELKADCYKEAGYPGLSCTSQRLTVADSDSGRELGGQSFKPAALQAGDAYPIIAEKVDQVVCAETPAKQKVIVVNLSNGGNCARCEWSDVYAWDGSLLGSSRDADKGVAVAEALKIAFDKKSKKLGQGDLSDVYAEVR
jgi:hypothetical protein